MLFDNLSAWLQWLESYHPSEIDLGLDRISSVAKRMQLNLGRSKVVTVAGTNGKGSCVATLNALLQSAGYSVACFTSPHFLRYNERIVVNSQPVSDQVIVDAFQRIHEAQGDTSLTYFEYGALAALDIFSRGDLDVVILEVGLGGRLDAVNLIDADIAIVTSIALDHQEWLGDSLEQIGREKAGIFRRGQFAISASSTAPDSVKESAELIGAHLYQSSREFLWQQEQEHVEYYSWTGTGPDGDTVKLAQLPAPVLPVESVSAALQALMLLGLELKDVDYSVLAETTLPGRYQRQWLQGRQIILDVAHNPAAAAYLAEKLAADPIEGRTLALFSVMADKDVVGIVEALKLSFDAWYLVGLADNARAIREGELAQALANAGVAQFTTAEDVAMAISEAVLIMSAEDRLVVFGSFYTVTEALAYIQQHEVSTSA